VGRAAAFLGHRAEVQGRQAGGGLGRPPPEMEPYRAKRVSGVWGKDMYKMVGLWFILGVCLLVIGYGAYLAVANGPRETDLMLYPWQEGRVLGIWVLAVVLGMGMALVPLVRLLVRTVRDLRAVRREAAEAEARRDEPDAGAGRL